MFQGAVPEPLQRRAFEKMYSEMANAEFSISPDGADTTEILVSLKNGLDNPYLSPTVVTFWLSDQPTGVGLTATTPSGGLDVAMGNEFAVLTADKAILLQAAGGTFSISLEDDAKTHYYPCLQVGPVTIVGPQLTTENYG